MRIRIKMAQTIIMEYSDSDIADMVSIWNEVVEQGIAFPQLEYLDVDTGKQFFDSQSFAGVAKIDGKVAGMYILHPNNVGRCGHIANASFAVSSLYRGKKIGKELVRHCLAKGRELGFKIMQFNAVVSSNVRAIKLYEKLGFVRVGVVPGGFLNKDDVYEDIIVYYYNLQQI